MKKTLKVDDDQKGQPTQRQAKIKMRASLKQILRHEAPWDLSLCRVHTLYAKLTQILTLRTNNINVL